MFMQDFIDYTSSQLSLSPQTIPLYLESGHSPKSQLDYGRFRVLEEWMQQK